MAKKKSRRLVPVEIQYQIKVGEGDSKTYEFSHAASMRASKAGAEDDVEREVNLLKVLVKEFKRYARDQKKILAKRRKQMRKSH